MLGTNLQRSFAAALTAAAVAVGVMKVTGQEPRSAPPDIQSLGETGQGLDMRVRAASGAVTFASRVGRGVLLPGLGAAPAGERAMAFVEGYGAAFGLRAPADARVIGSARVDSLGQDHVRVQQLHQGIPVTGAELLVHLEGDRVIAANGHTLDDLPSLPGPSLPAAAAVQAARELIEKHQPERAADTEYSETRLEVFNRAMIDQGTYPTRLAWFVEARGERLREYIWIDAYSGVVLLNFSQLAEAKQRAVFDMGHASDETRLPGALVRSEGQRAVADPDVNHAYDFSGQTYDYFAASHGRDSYDDEGASIRSSVHFGIDYQNAFWNGAQMVYGDGFAAADDVVAHELTHAVTESAAGLFYYYQSGALNESFSDIFGETMDLTTGLTSSDLPTERWLIGEDLSIGAIRDMMRPTDFGDPGKMSDPEFVCRTDGATNPNSDSGGVHSNSGVPNHAFALMVDGGTFNGRNITGLGLPKAAQIQYRALTRYLTSGATFADNAAALNQSCTDLTGTFGITSADCLQVNNAILAVEMTNPWPCATATPPPAAYCPIGTAPNPAILADGFESGFGNWTPSSTAAGIWGVTTGFARTGVRSVWGEDVNDTSDHRLTMTTPLTLPAAARMSFDHAFEFEHSVFSGVAFDGGLIEYSTDGTAWSDAGGFIDAGQAYNGTFAPGNVLGERPGFVRSSFGYTASRLNLSGLAGQRVRFRFRIGTDTSVGSLGWIMDNVRIYTCGTALPPTTVGDTYTTPFETTLQVAAPGVLLNDRENGGGTVTAQLVTNVSNGSLALNTNGSLAYTPRAGFSGTDTFSYRAVSSTSEPGNIVTVTIATAPRAPDPPSGLYAVSIVGSTVTLRWSAPVGDPAPTGYLVEGGLSPGGVIASFATRGTAPIATFEAPRGSFYVRIHALSGSTRSVASNEILIHVNVPVAPSAPANLLGMVDGSNVALAWTNTFAGGPPATVHLEVTGAANTTVPVSATESVQFAGVPDGTYTVRLRAQNPGGVSAGASNSVTLTFPGDCSGVPLAPTNVLMFNSGPTIVVIWEPPMTGAAPTSYVVDVNGAFVGSFPTTRRSLAGSAGPGSYTLSVRATNACGSGPATAPQTVTIP